MSSSALIKTGAARPWQFLVRRPNLLWLPLVALLLVLTATRSARADTYTVTNANAAGAGSLSNAIAQANGNPGTNIIAFAILPTNGTVQTITLSNSVSLPNITRPVIIDGYTQPGASANTLTNGDKAKILIRINGGTASPIMRLCDRAFCGGTVGSSGSIIRGLCFVQESGSGFMLDVHGSNNIVAGNFFGVDTDGTTLAGSYTPIELAGGSFPAIDNLIGGTSPAARNVIASSGGFALILNDGNNTLVQGNYLGVNAAGTAPLGSCGFGIQIEEGSGVTIGGSTPGAGNVINATSYGVNIDSGSAINTTVQGNLIGTDATGTKALNSLATCGIQVGTSLNTIIGGAAPGAGNVVSVGGSGGYGIIVVHNPNGTRIQGNKIGTDLTGTIALGNGACGVDVGTFGAAASTSGLIGGTNAGEGNIIAFNRLNGVSRASGNTGWSILGNSIHDNGHLGISLVACGTSTTTTNDPCDTDPGANNPQNYPVITGVTVSGGNVTLSGTLNSVSNTTYRLEFFGNASCDASGFGQGQVFLGATNVTTAASCTANFGLTLLNPGGNANFTATATDPSGNTSEFSACASVSGPCTIICPGNMVVSTAPSQCGAVVNFSPTTSGNCGGVICSPASGSFFPKGTNTVICSTASGTNCSFTIAVIDTVPPTIACPANIFTNVPLGQSNAVVTYTTVFSDNCGLVTSNSSPPSDSVFPFGVTTVTCTATDTSGNSNSCSFTVTVANTNLPPIARCQNVTTNAGASCQADVPASTVDNGSSDPDGTIVSRTLSPPGPYPKGTNSVMLTVVDNLGASNSCTALIIVLDTTPPTITCPGNVVTNAPHEQNSVVVAFPAATVTDNCSGASATATCTPPSGSTFPLGVTTVTCATNDASGNSNSCSFTVTVNRTIGTLTWSGAGANGFWTNAANWVGGVAPVDLDALVFPTNAARFVTTNTPGGPTNLSSITLSSPGISSSYDIYSPPLTLFNGVTNLGIRSTDNLFAAVTIGGDQTWFLNPAINGLLTLSSNVTLLTNKLTLNSPTVILVLNGPVAGSAGSQFLVDAGSAQLNGSSNDIPDLQVRAGVLFVNGVLSGGLSISNGASLQGNGTVPPFKCAGKVAPGGEGSTGLLTVSAGIASFSGGSSLEVVLAGSTSPGTDYDQLRVATPPDLSGATLVVSPSYLALAGETYVIITNTGALPFTTTFAGLPEGAVLVVTGSFTNEFRISYAGGDGNDVVLTRVPNGTASRPRLAIEPAPPNAARLLWPTNPAGFSLQSNTNLLTTNWIPGSPPSVLGTNNVVTNATTPAQQFYRLKQ